MVKQANDKLSPQQGIQSTDTSASSSGIKVPNPDREGVIRHVPKAHLVYKRKQPDGTFTEMWIYNIERDIKQELKMQRAVLSGTDILPGSVMSADGTQNAEIWSTGNAQIIQITGLPQ
jgi:hypothetical protein